MSSIAIAGDTSGLVTIQAPAVAGTVVLTTPTASGTLLTTGSLISIANGGTGLVASGTSGNLLTSNGTAWVSTTPVPGLPTQTSNSGKLLTTDGTNASWMTPLGASVIRSARTTNTILGVADNSTLIDITSGSFSQTFTAAATLGSGWFCYIRNAGTGDITLDPNASELIDGLTSYVMYPNEVRLIQCTGTALTSVVLTSFYRTFIASDTFTKPPGYSQFGGLLWGAGGGGGGGAAFAYAGGGGGGGCCARFLITSGNEAATLAVTIGSGGLGSYNSGSVGGNSTISTAKMLYGYGGGGGSIGGGAGGGGHGVGGGAGGTAGGNAYKVGYNYYYIQPGSRSHDNYTGEVGHGMGHVGGGGGTLNTGYGYGGGDSEYGGSGGGAGAGYGNSNYQQGGGSTTYGGAGGSGGTRYSPSPNFGKSLYAGNGGTGGVGETHGSSGGIPAGGGGGGGFEGGSGGNGARGELRIWGIV